MCNLTDDQTLTSKWFNLLLNFTANNSILMDLNTLHIKFMVEMHCTFLGFSNKTGRKKYNFL